MNEQLQILLIEDDKNGRSAIRDALEVELSCQLAEAENSFEGENLLNQQVFDCILLDFLLPNCNGLDFLTKIRQAGVFTPVIMLTNVTDTETAVALMKAGASDFIPKTTLTPKRLASSINQSIGAYDKMRRSNATLRQYIADLEVRNGEIEVFSGEVAHDLKNIFSPIIGMAQLLQGDYGEMLDEHAHFVLDNIVKGATQGFNLLDALLFLARLQYEKPEVVPLDMGKVVDNVVQHLSFEIKEIGAELIMPASWLPVLGDDMWVSEVWFNYLLFILKQNITPLVIELGCTQLDNGQTEFWIQDNGANLTPTQKSSLFSSVNQLQQYRDSRQGLGMAIARQIVEALSGTVGVESTLGVGNRYSFTLPAFSLDKE